MTTTWSAVNISSAMALSGGNLIATQTAGFGREEEVKSADGALKAYFELVTGSNRATSQTFGVANASAAIGSGNAGAWPGKNANSIGYQDNGTVSVNSATVATLLSYATGDVLGVAFDQTNIWFRKNGGLWNNSGTADPVAGTGGIAHGLTGTLFAMVATYDNGLAWTGRFLTSSWGTAAPSGFVEFNPPATADESICNVEFSSEVAASISSASDEDSTLVALGTDFQPTPADASVPVPDIIGDTDDAVPDLFSDDETHFAVALTDYNQITPADVIVTFPDIIGDTDDAVPDLFSDDDIGTFFTLESPQQIVPADVIVVVPDMIGMSDDAIPDLFSDDDTGVFLALEVNLQTTPADVIVVVPDMIGMSDDALSDLLSDEGTSGFFALEVNLQSVPADYTPPVTGPWTAVVLPSGSWATSSSPSGIWVDVSTPTGTWS